MSAGELLTRATIWLALAGYGAAITTLLQARRQPRWLAAARVLWTVAGLIYLAHVVCAFQFYHHWSHATAWQETARQTAEVVGRKVGAGLLISYAFTLAWMADLIWWWVAGLESIQQRPRWVTIVWQSFFAFMVFNGTVVFEAGPVRWFGLALLLGLGILWILSRRQLPGNVGN